jgi:hypothetical protein
MNSNPLIGLVAAGLVALAAVGAATPGNALACSGGLGEDCAPAGITEPASNGLGGMAGRIDALSGLSATATPETGAVRVAGGGCGGAAAQAAAASGGQVIGAPKVVQRGGQTTCVVTVLIKDPAGKKPPTRKQITVPAN